MRSDRVLAAALVAVATLNAAPAAAAAASGLEVGCSWIPGSDAMDKNTGFIDAEATYSIVSIPVNPGPSVRYVVRGKFPKIRHFGFQSYDGYRPGNLIDSLPDSRITPIDGAPPAANPAVLPQNGGLDNNAYTNEYEFEIRYENPPANPAARVPNVLYAGLDSQRGALAKQIVYRTYFPNPGAGRMGDADLPTVTYFGPKGEDGIDLRDTPEEARCNRIKRSTKALSVFPVVAAPTARPKWKPVSGAGEYVYYPNGDINYMRALTAARYGDMVLVRAKMPLTPVLPPVVIPNPEVRYWSLCQYQLTNSAVVACIADRNMHPGPDGWINVVISKPEKRPANVLPELGFDWLPHGPSDNAGLGFRQLLVKPSFVGSYAKSVAEPSKPPVETLGEWAPLITYCDRGTFDSHAGDGGQAVFDACVAAYRPWNQIF